MKTLTTFFLMLFAFTVAAEAKVKKVSITKVEKSIKDDAEKALKDHPHFEASFKMKDYRSVSGIEQYAKVKSKYETPVIYGKGVSDHSKRATYECKLEKYTKDDGKEGVRIRIISQIK